MQPTTSTNKHSMIIISRLIDKLRIKVLQLNNLNIEMPYTLHHYSSRVFYIKLEKQTFLIIKHDVQN